MSSLDLVVRVYGSIRNQQTSTIEAEAIDVDTAKADIQAQLPSDLDIIQYRTESKSGQLVHVTATVRTNLSLPHEATAADYETAYDEYRRSIPEGWISLGFLVDRDQSVD